MFSDKIISDTFTKLLSEDPEFGTGDSIDTVSDMQTVLFKKHNLTEEDCDEEAFEVLQCRLYEHAMGRLY